MTFSAEEHRTEGQSRLLKSTLNKLKSLNFYFARLDQQFLKEKIFVKKGHPGNASGHLRCVICSNIKHYHSCSLGDGENNDDTEIQTAGGCVPAYEHPKK